MLSEELRSKFLEFFKKRGHVIIPSASLVPDGDSSVLFNIAGMQPLMPYLLGEKHPSGKRLVNIQKSVRTIDLDDVGDNTHLTFFEMMGNWSLGDYFKEDAIKWSYEFLTSKKEGLGLSPANLYITVFGGDNNIPRDTESVGIWASLGIPRDRIYFKSSKSNWWTAGLNSPAGPSTEMFYDLTGKLGDMTQEEFEKAELEQKVVEIWNDVFMVYRQEEGKVVEDLPEKNVDTGAGFERLVAVVQGKNSIYDTDIFSPLVDEIIKNVPEELLAKEGHLYIKQERSIKIIADHIRTSVFLIADGVTPENSGRGYVLRRLIRRIIVHANDLGIQTIPYSLIGIIAEKYKKTYPNVFEKQNNIERILREEELKFSKTLSSGLKEFEKGTDPFVLFTTYGFPIELTEELAKEKNIKIDHEDFDKKMVEHQRLSQTSSLGMFKGGLANHESKTIRLHTAHHLLLAGLKNVVGDLVKQKGSNINEERLRMDFICDHKLTDDEKKKVEEWVNDKIKRKLKVIRREMPKEEAEKIGAEMEFGAKYPGVVSVYLVEDENNNAISKEFCGGPHVENTAELGTFKIQKEEAISAGVRRIKGILV